MCFMSHGYLACGFLPVRLAFPCIVGILRGQVTIPDSVLVESFVDSLNAHKSSVMKEAIASKVVPLGSQYWGFLPGMVAATCLLQTISPS